MADEDIATPVVSLDPPASDPVVETEKPVEIVDEEVIPDLPDDEIDTPTDDETDELEFGFKKYKVPKELKADVEAWRTATTQKEQTVATERKALEAARLKQAEATDAELDARAQLRTITAEMERFNAFDFNAYQQLKQTDFVGAEEAWAYKQHLKEQHAALTETVTKAASERTELSQQDLAKRVQETASEAIKIIPGLKADAVSNKVSELVSFAQSEGIPEQVLKDLWSPVFLKLLHRAQVGTLAMQKQATAAPKPAAVSQPVIAPLEKVAGRSTPAASKTIGDIAKSGDMEAYAAARKLGRVR